MTEQATRTKVRVYYEDTDFSGRVYHASYVRFLERGRTEWLRDRGFAHPQLFSLDVAFAVTRLDLDFTGAAFIDDALEVVTRLLELRGATIVFHQTVERADVRLVGGLVNVVTIRKGRAARPPRELLATLAPQNTPPRP